MRMKLLLECIGYFAGKKIEKFGAMQQGGGCTPRVPTVRSLEQRPSPEGTSRTPEELAI